MFNKIAGNVNSNCRALVVQTNRTFCRLSSVSHPLLFVSFVLCTTGPWTLTPIGCLADQSHIDNDRTTKFAGDVVPKVESIIGDESSPHSHASSSFNHPIESPSPPSYQPRPHFIQTTLVHRDDKTGWSNMLSQAIDRQMRLFRERLRHISQPSSSLLLLTVDHESVDCTDVSLDQFLLGVPPKLHQRHRHHRSDLLSHPRCLDYPLPVFSEHLGAEEEEDGNELSRDGRTTKTLAEEIQQQNTFGYNFLVVEDSVFGAAVYNISLEKGPASVATSNKISLEPASLVLSSVGNGHENEDNSVCCQHNKSPRCCLNDGKSWWSKRKEDDREQGKGSTTTWQRLLPLLDRIVARKLVVDILSRHSLYPLAEFLLPSDGNASCSVFVVAVRSVPADQLELIGQQNTERISELSLSPQAEMKPAISSSEKGTNFNNPLFGGETGNDVGFGSEAAAAAAGGVDGAQMAMLRSAMAGGCPMAAQMVVQLQQQAQQQNLRQQNQIKSNKNK